MPITVSGTSITFNDSTTQTTAFTGSGNVQFSLALRGSAVNSSGSPMVFNSTGSLTWTCPTGVTRIKLVVAGGGGGGGGGTSGDGRNGGTGGLGVGIYTVTPGTAYTVTIGAGGAGVGTGTGGAGGSSSFGALLTSTGGGGGGSGTNGGGGAHGTATLGNIVASSARLFSANELGRLNTFTGNGLTTYSIFPNVNSGGATTAQVYSTTFSYGAGAAGGGGTSGCCVNTNGGGGVSGAVYIEYVGS